ncbi:MAG: ABC transporter ATP-binding protein, partial [Streptococcus orisratti]|nr:ABC transporter ATP-binding protein [Streptococcus orisratti]
MTHTVIKVVNLSKQFKSKQILQDISFEVKEGDCLA